ncbi:PH domain-containing protein [Streptomyces sp. NPDC002588]|uniref:PH domain-containing protein n=1 Tax=Streptomyces sp. NPDC002588 TaxID=3154419 RepID=UPI00332C7680
MNRGIEREYRRRRAVPATYVTLAAAVVVAALKVLDSVKLGPMRWDALVLVAWLGLAARVALEQWRARTTVTAAGITVRGPLRTRTWAWADIYGIRVENSRRGSPHWPAYLYATDGRRVRLHHFDELQLDDPVAELADLCDTALELGLTSLRTRPEVEERIQRGTRRRTAGRRAGLAALVVLVAMFTLDGWLFFTDRPENPFLLIACVPLLCLAVFFLVLDRVGEALAARRAPDPA